MAVETHRKYVGVTLPNAAASTKMLRAAVGQDAADNTNLPIEKFLAVEATGYSKVTQ